MMRVIFALLAALTASIRSGVAQSQEPLVGPAFQGGCQTWDYFLDTWRIVPERLDVSDGVVKISWHIADVYIPGTPGAKDEPFEGAVASKLDDNPGTSDYIFARAADSERPRTLAFSDVGKGQHRLVVSLFSSGGFKLGQFESCFKSPGPVRITHKQWRDLGGEAWQTP